MRKIMGSADTFEKKAIESKIGHQVGNKSKAGLMRKAVIVISAASLLLLLCIALVYGLTLTSDATESVLVPLAALGTVCLINPATSECSDTQSEILWGNAVIHNFAGDDIGIILIQFGGQLYRATSIVPVYELEVTSTNGTILIANSKTINSIENIERVETKQLIGLQGELSQVLTNGREIATTGEVRIYEDEKGRIQEPVPVGEYYVEYSNLALENSEECGPYNYLDEQGQPVKGTSTRECSSRMGIMTAGEYTGLELILNVPGADSTLYHLTAISGTTNFTWEPE